MKIFILSLLISTVAAAKLGPSKHVDAWVGAIAGTWTFNSPEGRMASDGHYSLGAGIDMSLIGPLHFSLGIAYGGGSGKIQYDHTGSDGVHYTGSDVPYFAYDFEGWAGLQIQLFPSSFGHLFVGGGWYAVTSDIYYDTDRGAKLGSVGSHYQREQIRWGRQGTYAEVGGDILFSDWGFRIALRGRKGETDELQAAGNSRFSYVEGQGYIAYLAQLTKN